MMPELSLNILDIAQNSIRAKARLVEITVEERLEEDRLVITVADDGRGMDIQQTQQVQDPFYTTRDTRKVGLGVPFFKMAAEITGGTFDIRSAPGEGTVVTATFGLHHIDRMPLGDMGATYCALVQCNPKTAFVYTYRRGEKAFAIDTRQLREILGDISLAEPQVLAFIKEMIEENTAELINESSHSGFLDKQT